MKNKTNFLLVALVPTAGRMRTQAAELPVGKFPPELKGAFYCRLDSGESWEQLAKVGPHADVKVRFGNPANSMIFWRASSYLPLWQTASGQWCFDELVPRQDDGAGLRTDKICQMSRVAIIEDSPARAQVLWRYLPDFTNPALESWVEETFTVYPDGVCVRAVRKGTPTLKEWLDPANTKVQEVMLAEDGIQPLAESRGAPIVLKLSARSSSAFEDRGIDRPTRSHVFECKQRGQPVALTFELQAGGGTTIHNPVIVVRGWGDADVQVTVGGKKFTAYKTGYVRNMNLKGGDLVVWMNLASEQPTEIVLTPVGGSTPIARAPVRDPYNSKVPLFPEGSSDPGPFGAYYTQLKYFPEWDAPWRVGDAADIVVQFDDQTSRFVFWRGPAYVPEWVNDQNHWYNNEFYERRPKDGGLKNGGCAEPMQDYDCKKEDL